VALNLCTIAGFGVIDTVLAGTTLSAVANGHIDATTGIVITAIVGMFIAFGGYRVLHQYERYSWVFALVAIVIATGTGGSELMNQASTKPAAAATVVSFGGVIAGFLIPWAVSSLSISTIANPLIHFSRLWHLTSASIATRM
jgi:purine-cytosine permease-like protein